MFKERLELVGLVIVFALMVGGCEEDYGDLECRDTVCRNLCIEHGIGDRGWCEGFDFEVSDPDSEELAPWDRSICVCKTED